VGAASGVVILNSAVEYGWTVAAFRSRLRAATVHRAIGILPIEGIFAERIRYGRLGETIYVLLVGNGGVLVVLLEHYHHLLDLFLRVSHPGAVKQVGHVFQGGNAATGVAEALRRRRNHT
jgi:hypothetical protein